MTENNALYNANIGEDGMLKHINFEYAEPEDDPVHHPSHYTQGEVECIEAIMSSMGSVAYKGYLKGNIIKYVWRYENKGGLTDLLKAQFYLDRLIDEVAIDN